MLSPKIPKQKVSSKSTKLLPACTPATIAPCLHLLVWCCLTRRLKTESQKSTVMQYTALLNKCRWDKKARRERERERERERGAHAAGFRRRDILCFRELVLISSPFLQTCTGDKKNKPRTTIIYTTEREDKIIDSESCGRVVHRSSCMLYTRELFLHWLQSHHHK